MSIFSKEVLVYRVGAQHFEAGEWVGEDDSTFTILASVQPLNPREATEAASILQGKESYRLFQPIEIGDEPRLRSVEDKGSADHIVLNGKRYEVCSVSDWNNGVIPHYSILVRALVPITQGMVGATA